VIRIDWFLSQHSFICLRAVWIFPRVSFRLFTYFCLFITVNNQFSSVALIYLLCFLEVLQKCWQFRHRFGGFYLTNQDSEFPCLIWRASASYRPSRIDSWLAEISLSFGLQYLSARPQALLLCFIAHRCPVLQLGFSFLKRTCSNKDYWIRKAAKMI